MLDSSFDFYRILVDFGTQVGSPNRSKNCSKLNLDAKTPPSGPQKPLEDHFGPSKGRFWTLQGSIWDLPEDEFSLIQGILFHAFPCRHRLYHLSIYLAACRCCHHGVPGSLGRRVPALALTIIYIYSPSCLPTVEILKKLQGNTDQDLAYAYSV